MEPPGAMIKSERNDVHGEAPSSPRKYRYDDTVPWLAISTIKIHIGAPSTFLTIIWFYQEEYLGWISSSVIIFISRYLAYEVMIMVCGGMCVRGRVSLLLMYCRMSTC